MKKSNPDNDFEPFFLELPQADYLNDIDIQDAYDEPCDDQKGLSEQQVSEIARDSRQAARREDIMNGQTEPSLFSEENEN
jgi:hypothetical protein